MSAKLCSWLRNWLMSPVSRESELQLHQGSWNEAGLRPIYISHVIINTQSRVILSWKFIARPKSVNATGPQSRARNHLGVYGAWSKTYAKYCVSWQLVFKQLHACQTKTNKSIHNSHVYYIVANCTNPNRTCYSAVLTCLRLIEHWLLANSVQLYVTTDLERTTDNRLPHFTSFLSWTKPW